MAVTLGSTGITFPDATTQTTAASGGGSYKSTQVFQSAGTFTYTRPAGLIRANIIVQGGGGGGGDFSNCRGGAAGGTAILFNCLAATIGATQTVTVGAGGAAGATGAAGGTSSFGSICSATGGQVASTLLLPNGGIGTGGTLNLRGQGTNYSAATSTGGTPGGNGYFAGGGAAGASNNPSPGQAGVLGGGGGGGGFGGNGASGGAGVVVVEEYF